MKQNVNGLLLASLLHDKNAVVVCKDNVAARLRMREFADFAIRQGTAVIVRNAQMKVRRGDAWIKFISNKIHPGTLDGLRPHNYVIDDGFAVTPQLTRQLAFATMC